MLKDLRTDMGGVSMDIWTCDWTDFAEGSTDESLTSPGKSGTLNYLNTW